MTSPDGITWTIRNSPTVYSGTQFYTNSWQSVTWGGLSGSERFVAVGDKLMSFFNPYNLPNGVMVSRDGIVWSLTNSQSVYRWCSVVWGGVSPNEVFVAVSDQGSGNQVMTSDTNANTWFLQSGVPVGMWKSVTWGGPIGGKLFVSVGAISGCGASCTARIMTSPDGITWSNQTSPVDNDWNCVTWGGPSGQELFVAVASSGTGNRVMTSPDGINWTVRSSAADYIWTSVTWGGLAGQESFVAVAASGIGNRVMTSLDGINWTLQSSAYDSDWKSVAWGGPSGKFVAVAPSGPEYSIMTT
jgi:hypothetical protein